MSDTRHASRTLHEYPTVADVDGDGSSEIIIPNGGGHLNEDRNGIYVLGPKEGSWLMSRRVWNQHAYSLTNVEDDLSIPAVPELNWLEHNTCRSGDPQPMPSWYAPDAVPLAEVCYTDCPQGQVTLFVRLGNEGRQRFVRTCRLRCIQIQTSPASSIPFGPAASSMRVLCRAPFHLTLDADLVIGEWLLVVVDDDGVEYVSDECVEDNNSVEFWDVRCLQ